MPDGASHLARYSQVFPAAEINASFYKPIRRELYAKWAASVPQTFRFSVKIPRAITHEARLLDCDEAFAEFLDGVVDGLGDRLGCLLIQLPPSFEFEESLVGAFLERLRAICDLPVALEPRHASWFNDDVDALLRNYDVAGVAADPAVVPRAALPFGSRRVAYYRLHGSPRVYWSRYDHEFIARLGERLQRSTGVSTWCIFDNTASGSALPNALELMDSTNTRRGLTPRPPPQIDQIVD